MCHIFRRFKPKECSQTGKPGFGNKTIISEEGAVHTSNDTGGAECVHVLNIVLHIHHANNQPLDQVLENETDQTHA
jgi:hypothetical protein